MDKFNFQITAKDFSGKPHFVHHILYETHFYFSQEAVKKLCLLALSTAAVEML